MIHAHRPQNGFTLVELSIVMIIIGLLIGGIFGGMKIVDNMNINKTIQDLKQFESAAISFRDAYKFLPGDIVSPSTRLPNCTAAPCSTAGNGDRTIGGLHTWVNAITATDERFTFWSHLSAAELIDADIDGTTSLLFGEGQPENPINGGYRHGAYYNTSWCDSVINASHIMLLMNAPSQDSGTWGAGMTFPCRASESIDRKLDDGMPITGNFKGGGCTATCAVTQTYVPTANGYGLYVNKY